MENKTFAEIPSLDDSPLATPVIQREIPTLNQVAETATTPENPAVSQTQTAQKPPQYDLPDDEINPPNNTPPDDAPEMQFSQDSGSQNDLPPEMTDFSVNSILDITNLFLPQLIAGYVEIPEGEVKALEKEVGVKDLFLPRVRTINKSNHHEIESKVKSFTPYLSKPLKEVFRLQSLSLPPEGVLTMLLLFMGFTLFVTASKMKRDNAEQWEEMKAEVLSKIQSKP